MSIKELLVDKNNRPWACQNCIEDCLNFKTSNAAFIYSQYVFSNDIEICPLCNNKKSYNANLLWNGFHWAIPAHLSMHYPIKLAAS